MPELDPLTQAYVASRPKSAAIHARAKGVFAAQGATHFARVKSPFRPYITHAAGAYKWDVDGHRYLDYVMGHGALVLGHSHPAVVAAITAQAAKGVHFGDNHELEVIWAEAIRAMMPIGERIEFFASGQEANQMGLRIARAYTGRRKLLKFQHNYHGWADELCAVGSPGSLSDYVTVIPANDLGLLERTLASQDFAVALIEAGGARLSGRIPTGAEFFRQLPEVARKFGTVVLLDEVVTGFRESSGGWQSVVGMKPDLTTIGKAASGGLAAGALLGRAEVMACLSPESTPAKNVVHGGTWNGVPMTCAAGIAACDLYRGDGPQRRAAEMAQLLRTQANRLFREGGLPARLYGRSITHVYLGPISRDEGDGLPVDRIELLADPMATPRYQRLDLQLLHRGISTIRGEGFTVSAAHSEADITATAALLGDAVGAMVAEGSLAF